MQVHHADVTFVGWPRVALVMTSNSTRLEFWNGGMETVLGIIDPDARLGQEAHEVLPPCAASSTSSFQKPNRLNILVLWR